MRARIRDPPDSNLQNPLLAARVRWGKSLYLIGGETRTAKPRKSFAPWIHVPEENGAPARKSSAEIFQRETKIHSLNSKFTWGWAFSPRNKRAREKRKERREILSHKMSYWESLDKYTTNARRYSATQCTCTCINHWTCENCCFAS